MQLLHAEVRRADEQAHQDDPDRDHDGAVALLTGPGNIRELENFIERAVILSRGSSLEPPLAELTQRTVRSRPRPLRRAGALSTLEDAEREHIRRALEQTNWLVGGPSGAAARLGMKRTTLQSKMERLGIERPPR